VIDLLLLAVSDFILPIIIFIITRDFDVLTSNILMDGYRYFYFLIFHFVFLRTCYSCHLRVPNSVPPVDAVFVEKA
jgi:Sec-independent protein secretion pathway component TatC